MVTSLAKYEGLLCLREEIGGQMLASASRRQRSSDARVGADEGIYVDVDVDVDVDGIESMSFDVFRFHTSYGSGSRPI